MSGVDARCAGAAASERQTTTANMFPWTHRHAVVNGVRLHYVEAGRGPLVVLLHGFPDFWYGWGHQIPALAAAGFRVLAPDLRGYNESDKPPGVENYRVEKLVADVLALIAHAGVDRAFVVGHDWGGGIAWRLAMQHPSAVAKLAILNAPHPALFLRELKRPRQFLRSWYILFFQFPRLPELLLSAGNYAMLERTWRAQPSFTEEDIRLYKAAIAQPGALSAAINYYRAVFRHMGHVSQTIRPVAMPTLILWGERDPYLDVRLIQGLERWAPDLRIERFPDAGHWVHNDLPEQVNANLVEFFKEN